MDGDMSKYTLGSSISIILFRDITVTCYSYASLVLSKIPFRTLKDRQFTNRPRSVRDEYVSDIIANACMTGGVRE